VLPTVTSVPSVWAAPGLTAIDTATTAAVASAPAAATLSSAPDPATVSLTRLTPAIALPKAAVTISGSVHNAGLVSITSPVVRAFIGDQPLTSRDAVSQWADTNVDQQLVTEGVRTPLGQTLRPGGSAAFTLTLPATAISHRESFAVLPLLVDVVGTVPAGSTSSGTSSTGPQNLGSLHTFLPTLSAVKRYEPFSIAWLVPLTLDPDPALFGPDTAARTAAWTKAIGPGSRLDGVIAGTDSSKVTWALPKRPPRRRPRRRRAPRRATQLQRARAAAPPVRTR